MNRIDLNCDLGEGYGIYSLGEDESLLDVISSANIACGFHAGDPMIMLHTVRKCIEKGVSIGAHPGYPDLHGFGRREIIIPAKEVYAQVLYQIGALKQIVEAEGGQLIHVKPHGALYNMACRDERLAEAIAEAVYHAGAHLKLYGLPGSELLKAGKKLGLICVAEGFIDRKYLNNGWLAPRSQPGSVIDSIDSAVAQAISLAKGNEIAAIDGTPVKVEVETLCIHGDGPYALETATVVRDVLLKEGFQIHAV